MVDYEKEARSTLSSRNQPGSSSDSIKSSGAEGVERENYGPEAEKSETLAQIQTAHTQHGEPIKPTETREDGSEYPSGLKLALISLALCLSVFLIALE
jgi:hypothetical protein